MEKWITRGVAALVAGGSIALSTYLFAKANIGAVEGTWLQSTIVRWLPTILQDRGLDPVGAAGGEGAGPPNPHLHLVAEEQDAVAPTTLGERGHGLEVAPQFAVIGERQQRNDRGATQR